MAEGRDGGLKLFLVAGETSGDNLGAKLMRELRARQWNVQFEGVGGPQMEAEGLKSLFPMADIAVMGFLPVIRRLPTLIERIRATAMMVERTRPDALVIVDSPDFTHRVARRVRARMPDLPVVDYVSPTVWAWREGRAGKMRGYVDHVLALLPFEPAAHARLGGPACSYVGHPLVERLHDLRPRPEDALIREYERNVLILPGSRLSEVTRLLPVFGEAVARLADIPRIAFQLPVVPHVRAAVAAAVETWPVKPDLIEGEAAKWAAFRRARAALAASGTVTLELGMSGVPMAVAYKVSPVEKLIIQALVKVSTPVLPSLILGEEVTPVLLQEAANGEALAAALRPLVEGGAARQGQLEAFQRLDAAMTVPGNNPSAKAAEIVLGYARRGRAG